VDPDDRRSAHQRALLAVKVIHTLAWFSIESCMVCLMYAGLAKRSDQRAAVAAAVVGGESVVFAANGFRCPLTDVAESLGADDGSVTDIFLPRWFAHSLPAIHVPLILLTAYVHGRNLRRSRSAKANEAIPTIDLLVRV
jgi:hypothetical protein